MAVGEKIVGSITSDFPTTLVTFIPQSEADDPVIEDPEFAEGRDANWWSAEIEAMQATLGASPRGLVEVAALLATVGGFRTTDGTTLVTFAGGTVALTASVVNSIYFDLTSLTLVASTVGFPGTKHVPLATWPGTGTVVTDKRPHLPAANGVASPAAQFSFPFAILGLLTDYTLPLSDVAIELVVGAGTYTKFRAMRGTAGTAGTSTVELMKNGVVVASSALSFTSADAAFFVKTATIAMTVAVGDRVSLKLSAAETTARDLYAAASLT